AGRAAAPSADARAPAPRAREQAQLRLPALDPRRSAPRAPRAGAPRGAESPQARTTQRRDLRAVGRATGRAPPAVLRLSRPVRRCAPEQPGPRSARDRSARIRPEARSRADA